MFWCEHIYVAFSTTYVGYLTLHRKSAYLRRKKISRCLKLMETALTAIVDTVTASTRRITTVVCRSIMRYQMQLALSYTLCASTE